MSQATNVKLHVFTFNSAVSLNSNETVLSVSIKQKTWVVKGHSVVLQK